MSPPRPPPRPVGIRDAGPMGEGLSALPDLQPGELSLSSEWEGFVRRG